MRSSLLLSVAAASLIMAASPSLAGTWVPANPPSGAASFTLFGINDHNITTGAWVNSSGVTQGFVGPFDGSNYTSFTDGGSGTEPRAISDRGLITGYDTGTVVPWERFADGTVTNITKNKGTTTLTQVAQQINRTGMFAGNTDNASGVSVGYLGRNAKDKGTFAMPIPNAGYAGRALDDSGHYGGWYIDPSTGLQRGFVKAGFHITRVDFPGPNTAYTVVEGMNNHGRVSGQWEDTSGVIHGFIYDMGKGKHSYTSLDVPGATFTQVWGINNNDVVAASAAVSNVTQSFIYCIKANCPGTPGHALKMQPGGKPAKPAQN